MKRILFIIFISFANLSFGQGRVDGFYKGKGNLDIALGANIELNPNYYAGKMLINAGRNVYSANAFFAYGITNKFDVNLSVPYVNVNGSVGGIQDPAIFLKYQLFSFGKQAYRTDNDQDGLRIAYKPRIFVSLASGFSSNITDYQTEGLNALGQQAKTIDIRPVIHANITDQIFITLQGAYNYKFDPVPDAVAFSAKVGIARARCYADIWYDGQHGIGGLDYLGTPTPSTFRELGVNYHRIGGTFYMPFNNTLGWYGGLSYVLAGRNFSKGFGINLGIVIKPNLKK